MQWEKALVIKTDTAIKEMPGVVLGELSCDGLCISDQGDGVVEVEELRRDPCRCFRNIEQFPDPASVNAEEEEPAEEEQ